MIMTNISGSLGACERWCSGSDERSRDWGVRHDHDYHDNYVDSDNYHSYHDYVKWLWLRGPARPARRRSSSWPPRWWSLWWWWYIYIMMQCLCVCVSRKIITSHLRAMRRRREVRCLLGLAGRLWPSDDDDDDDDILWWSVCVFVCNKKSLLSSWAPDVC